MANIRATRDEVSDRFPVLGFVIQTGGKPYFEIVLTTRPSDSREKRSAGSFYSTHGIGPLPAQRGEAVYLVPPEVLKRFAGETKLYYGLATFTDQSRTGAEVVRIPSDNSPYVSLRSFSGRPSRRMQVGQSTAVGRRSGNGRYATPNPDELTWVGDQPQPGTEGVRQPSGGAGDKSAAPKLGSNGGSKRSETPGAPAAPQSATFDYNDGFGPMPTAPPAESEEPGIEGPIPDAPAVAASLRSTRPFDLTPEYPQASRFVPAASGNYRASATPRTINRIVIHITDGGANINGPISWFQNPQARVSAHYLVGQDGEVVQMVRHNDVAWHAGRANGDSIGIEHVARQPGAWTRRLGRPDPGLLPSPAEYCASAALVRWLCDQLGIPKDRDHIVGHAEADPKTTHTDCPNAAWDWGSFMNLVTSGSCEPSVDASSAPVAEAQSYQRNRASSLDAEETSTDSQPSDTAVAESPDGDARADLQVEVEEIRYALQDGKVNKVARVEHGSGGTTLVFDWAGQERRVPIVEIVDAPPGRPSTAGWTSGGGKMTTLSSVVSYILLYACGKWGKGYGTEIIYDVDGKRWLAKKANHNDTTSGGPRNFDHPGMDVYVAVAALAAGLGLGRRARQLEVTTDSPQAEQSQAVLEHIARSLQQKEGTRFNQVHYDSNLVNFGIGSWTGPRIATVLDAYETLATEQGSTATLYGYFGGKSGFDSLRSRFRSNSIGAPMAAAEKSALESLGGDVSLQDAQVRLLAAEVKSYVDAIATDNKYPFIDGYMNAVTEVAAHVLAHAKHQHGQVNDLIGEVMTNHGGDAAFGQEIADGTMDEHKFLMEIGEAVTRRVQSQYRSGVRQRYQDLIAQFEGSALGYYFDPSPVTTANALGRGGVGRSLSGESFTLNWENVEQIAQPTDYSCWAAAAAMVVGWRDNVSLAPDKLAEICGRTTATGLDPGQVQQFCTEIGLVFESPQSYTIEGFRRLLEASGPLWVGASVPGLHAIVVTGMYSDGAADGSDTLVRVTDPWDRVVGTPGSPGTYLNTHAQGSRYILKWADFVREYEAAATQYSSVNLQILHSDGTGGRTPTYGRPADYAMTVSAGSSAVRSRNGAKPSTNGRPAPQSAPARKMIRPSGACQLGDPGEIVPDYSQAQSMAQAVSMFFDWLSHEMKFRTGVHDARFFPHSAIAKLKLLDGSGNLLGEGSGFYVGRNKIVTAGHCLVNDDGSRVQGVEVIPGLHGTTEPFGGASIGLGELHPHPRYNPLAYDASFDLGVITSAPDAPNGDYFTMEELRLSPASGIITCGYAAVGVDPTIQHLDVDTIRAVQNGTFTFAAQVRPGSSGGPVFYASNPRTVRVVGLNVTTYDDQVNRGLRLTDPLIAWINSQ